MLAGAAGIGFPPILVRMSEVGPSATAFFRLLFALPFLWAWMWAGRSRRANASRPSARNHFFLFVLAGLFFTADLAIWHWSLQFTPVANSTLLANFAPLFVTLGARIFLNENIIRTFIAGIFVAFAGAALLVGGRLEIGSHNFLGASLALVAGIVYPGYLLL